MAYLDGGDLDRARQQIIGEGGRHRLAIVVIGHFLVHGRPDALGDAAANLPVDHHGVHHRAAILDHRIIHQFDRAAVGIDGDNGGVGGVGEHARGFAGLPGRGGVEHRVHAVGQGLLAEMGDTADFGQRHGPGRAVGGPVGESDQSGVALHQVAGDARHLLAQFDAGVGHRAAAHDDRARGEGAHAERRDRGVALADHHVVGVDAEFLVRDLG